MRRSVLPAAIGAALAALVVGLIGVVSAASVANDEPALAVDPQVVMLESGTKVIISGAGYQQGEEIHLLLMQNGAATSDLRSTVEPEIMVDGDGAFVTAWELGRLPRDLAEGPAQLVATNEDFQVLARAPIAFCDPESEEPGSWCPQPEQES